MSANERLFSYTTKVGRGNDLLTARGDTEEEFLASYESLLRIKERVEGQAPVTVEQATQNLKDAGVVASDDGDQNGGTEYDGRVDKKFDNTWFVYDRSNAPLTDAGEKAVLKWSRAQQSGNMYSQWVTPDVASGKIRGQAAKSAWMKWTPDKYDTSDLPKLPVTS